MMRPTWTITWNDEMSVGIPEVDEDHKHFVFLINEFNRSITIGMPQEEIKNRLQLIIDDAKRHFVQEERLFKEWQYPDADAHAALHAQALKSLQDIMKNFIPHGHDSEWINAGLEIRDILMNHIMNEDMKYAEFYRNSLVADSANEV